MRRILWICLMAAIGGAGFFAQSAIAQGRGEAGAGATAPLPTVAAKTTGMQKFDGYFPFYWDARAGKIWLQIDRWDSEFLFMESLPAGIGQNDLGLDRGQGGRSHIVKFQRTGPRVLMVEPNEAFRAITDNVDEQRAVEQSFPQSVMFGFDVAAEDGSTVLVDATNFFLRDAHNVTSTLAPLATGNIPSRPNALSLLSAAHQKFPEEYRSRSHAHIRQRRARPTRASGCSRRNGCDRARAPITNRIAPARIQTARLRPALGILRRFIHGFCRSD